MNGKLYVSHTKDEIKELVDSLGNPCEIDIGILKVLHEDISKIVQERLKEIDTWCLKITQVKKSFLAYILGMMNLTNSAKNHFLNFFSTFFKNNPNEDLKNYCRSEYGSDWQWAYNEYLQYNEFPRSFKRRNLSWENLYGQDIYDSLVLV